MTEEAKRLESYLNTGKISKALEMIGILQSSNKKLSFRVKNPNHCDFVKENLIRERESNKKTEKKAAKRKILPEIEEIEVVEARFCTVCCLEQPMRAKHCRECGKCIAVHDHHCP